MNYQFTIQFTEEQIKYALHKMIVRRFGIGFPIICLLLVIAFVEEFFVGQWDWFSGSLLGIAVVYSGRFVSNCMQRRSAALSGFKKMEGKVINYEFSDELFKAKSELGAVELKWEKFKALWIFPEVWLLLLRRGSYLPLPANQIDNDVKEFLKRKIVSIGGKIK
jgi:YcxB-like protein